MKALHHLSESRILVEVESPDTLVLCRVAWVAPFFGRRQAQLERFNFFGRLFSRQSEKDTLYCNFSGQIRSSLIILACLFA